MDLDNEPRRILEALTGGLDLGRRYLAPVGTLLDSRDIVTSVYRFAELASLEWSQSCAQFDRFKTLMTAVGTRNWRFKGTLSSSVYEAAVE